MALDKTQRAKILAETRKLWAEAKAWQAANFAGEPLIVMLRGKPVSAQAIDLDEREGKVGRSVVFRVTWTDDGVAYRVNACVGLQANEKGTGRPNAGVRVLSPEQATPTEGDVTWKPLVEGEASRSIREFCEWQFDRARRSDNVKKFFRYKQPADAKSV